MEAEKREPRKPDPSSLGKPAKLVQKDRNVRWTVKWSKPNRPSAVAIDRRQGMIRTAPMRLGRRGSSAFADLEGEYGPTGNTAPPDEGTFLSDNASFSVLMRSCGPHQHARAFFRPRENPRDLYLRVQAATGANRIVAPFANKNAPTDLHARAAAALNVICSK
jgi:hypothetical protein